MNRLPVAAFAVAVGCLSSIQAQASDVFVEAGHGRFDMPTNGLWWQDGFEHTDNLRSTFLRLGVEFKAARFLSFRSSVFDLGGYKIDAMGTPNDTDYTPGSPTNCPGPCPPLSRYLTAGTVRGVAFTAMPQVGNFFAEFGPVYYRQTFKLHIEDHVPYRAPSYDYSESRWHLNTVVGFGMRLGRFTVSAYRYNVGATFRQGDYPSGVKTYNVLSIGCTL